MPVLVMVETDVARSLDALREKLGQAAFAAAWTDGEALSLAETVALADAVFTAILADSPATAFDPAHGLTPRELDVVRLIAAGRSNQQIADALFISHRTIASHVTNIFTKLDLDSRTAVAAWAIRHGLD